MRCVHPLIIIKDGASYEVPCGRCVACRLNYANSWSTRIVSESKSWKFASFVTLTYNNENLPLGEKGVPTLVKRHCQNFFKEVRKWIKFRYFLGGEYGDVFGRPHYHICMFSDSERITDLDFLESCWRKGFVYVGSLTRDSANYVAKYCVKKLGGKASIIYQVKGIQPEFALMSRRPGIGTDYIFKYKDLVKNNGFVVVNGTKQPIPKFFGSKIFTDDEKNQHFIDSQISQTEEMQNEIVSGNADNIYSAKAFIHNQKSKQREINIKSRLNLKKKKL